MMGDDGRVKETHSLVTAAAEGQGLAVTSAAEPEISLFCANFPTTVIGSVLHLKKGHLNFRHHADIIPH